MWSRDTGQRIPCFDRCQLIITWMSNTKEVQSKPRLYDLVLAGVWPPPAIQAASYVNHKKELHGFLFQCMHVTVLLQFLCSATTVI